MEEALHDMALCREFAQLDAGATRLPDESSRSEIDVIFISRLCGELPFACKPYKR